MNNTAYFSFLLAIHFYSLFGPEIFIPSLVLKFFYSFFGPEIFLFFFWSWNFFIRSLVRKFLYLFFGPEILRIIFPSHKATILSSLPLRCHVPTAYIYIYISRGLAVYVTTSYWYLQITSQFHYQTKTQNNISNGSDSPQTSALCPNIRCLMTNWPCFLIKSNFITSLFNGTTAVSYIQFSNTEINCWKVNRNTANDIYWQAAKQLY